MVPPPPPLPPITSLLSPPHFIRLKPIAKTKSLPYKKLVWAYTLGLVAGERQDDRTDVNFSLHCRRKSLGNIALVDSMGACYVKEAERERNQMRRGHQVIRNIVEMLKLNFTDLATTLGYIVRFGKCLDANHNFHWHTLNQIKTVRSAIYKLPPNSSPFENPCSAQLHLITVAKVSSFANTKCANESNFPFHTALKASAWNEAANASYLQQACGVQHASWDCCPPIKFNLCIYHIKNESQFPPSIATRRRIFTFKKECYSTLGAWLNQHFDTKNLILIFAFLLGQLAKRYSQELRALDLSHIYLFPNETERSNKETFEMYRGPGVKHHLLDTMKRILFPLLNLQGLINLYSFCQEIRFSLMQCNIRKSASFKALAFYCATKNSDAATEHGGNALFEEAIQDTVVHPSLIPRL